ncbi:4a-hydroxytetrahydrobiopterin dehydratase [Catenuloplanes atrovinosus]|uniref:Putative pterin-4-alpha-carbinolamine dehydratase n=1 Tax=Catenuloplanes atrovinosus TaxID=137266 RepID=A0AAE3YYR6_9ACTN|nr:4a-hydroxytetrahydrobiopterin dehydratase [Catenuloplanes atrovinosus]MDR7280833.1 pterin-4a-carbinolamine dehydratase [Catenuloplanes atrovinosus]
MRALWSNSGRTANRDYLSDALTVLSGWTRDGQQLSRTLALNEAQHADLTERIKVAADALHLRPEIRRLEGETQIRVAAAGAESITEGQVALAARIEDAYRTVTAA